MPVCDHCQGKTQASFSSAFNKTLCAACKMNEPYKMLYKSTAKLQYFLTDKDLHEIEMFPGPKNRNGGACGHRDTFLIRESDVKSRFCQKFNIIPNEIAGKLQELRAIKAAKRAKRATTSAARHVGGAETHQPDYNGGPVTVSHPRIDSSYILLREQRKQELVDALAEYKLSLRADSKLCQGYINGTITDRSVDEIVHRMCQMHFLFNYANMDSCLDRAYEQHNVERNDGFFSDFSVFERAERLALKKRPYPSSWPWLGAGWGAPLPPRRAY